MSSWLKCSLGPGMLPGEYAVEMQTSDGRTISLFVPEDKVRADERLISVHILEENSGASLVRLPSPAFEISSRTVKVPSNTLVRT
jgi:hypothetical protein